ncbi:centrosomal protein of 192 kDa-like isoform X2 [Ruditapes philippinarum]|uniref:centrosomal protein of 192 kDa-like isoform X2 n=1 Tax=Ruditapes philippinarum TaxID=129788 RepID=UPI00295B216F|nr:centrosomal protein of 192 kDa-like isoform X2 [Ruditapes philippinarum]
MDVRGSLNADNNLSVVTGDGQMSFIESDSFYARVPPLAASTVARTKSRRDMMSLRASDHQDDSAAIELSFTGIETGARPKLYNRCDMGDMEPDSGGQPPGLINGTDWSDLDGKSSLGIINVDDMDISANNLLESPRVNLMKKQTLENDKSVQENNTGHSTLKGHSTVDSNPWHMAGSGSADSNTWKSGSSSSNNTTPSQTGGSSTNNSQDSKQDQPFARSQLGTVKKVASGPVKTDPIISAIRQSLFGQGAVIGEENEDGDASVYNVELEEQDLHDLDDDFAEMNCSVGVESDAEKSPEKTPTNKGDGLQLDSVYLRPGTTGEEQTHSKLSYLSKVSLFDGLSGGSGSEIDTEDELELARKAQGERIEAAGEDSDGHSRPGLEGLSLTDETRQQLPITQRQSAEGNVVTSPVPGDGGGGGDGSSGSDSEDGRSSADQSDRGRSSYHGNTASNHVSAPHMSHDQQEEQRIRPMGDDLLSDLRFSRFPSTRGSGESDTLLNSRYLRPQSPADNTNQPSFSIDDVLAGSRNGPLDHDFDPGNRLEASGFNADDASSLEKESNSNPFDVKSSSFGSFGLNGSDNSAQTPDMAIFSGEIIEADWMSSQSQDHDVLWTGTDLEGSLRTSQCSKASSLDSKKSLGHRSAASGSPTRAQLDSLSQQANTYDLPEKGNKSQLTDNEIIRKPTLPAPKAANFTKSSVKSRQSHSQGSSSGTEASRQSNVSNKSSQSSYTDLEFRTSLTSKTEGQMAGLKRVPSLGGANTMDFTVNDEDFFGNVDGCAMLDADEVQFNEEHVIRQDDAMVDTGSPNDSWAYRSIMTVARPSWLEGPEEEEEVCVRISVGTFMRGRTEALGSLGGEDTDERPDFGMTFKSPPKPKGRPARLIEEQEEDSVFESMRSSGVGQHGSLTPIRSHSEQDQDSTLKMDSLLKTPTPQSPLSITALTGEGFGLKPIATNDSTKLSMGEISMMLKGADTNISDFQKKYALKSKSKFGFQHQQTNNNSKVPSSIPSPSTASSRSPSKSSQLPVRKGSDISRSFRKVTNSDTSLLTSASKQKESSTDSGFRSGSVHNSIRTLTETEHQSADSNLSASPKTPTNDSFTGDGIWSSPNTSNFCPNTNGLLDKLDNFKFADSKQSLFQKELSDNLKEKLQTTQSKDTCQSRMLKGDNFMQNDREKTPPPDGQTNKDSDKISTNIKGVTPQVTRKFGDDFKFDNYRIDKDNTSSVENRGRQTSKGNSPVHDKRLLDDDMEWSRLDSSDIDHGYMPGHHIPDGTEYSQRSDYSHINHRGELREDVAGLDDVGLAEARGFDVLKHKDNKLNDLQKDNKVHNYNSDKPSSAQNKLSVNLQPTQSKSPMIRLTDGNGKKSQTVSQGQGLNKDDNFKIPEVPSKRRTEKFESWTQTSVVLGQTEPQDHMNIRQNSAPQPETNKSFNASGIPPQHPVSSFKHNLLPNNQSAVSETPHLLTKQSLMQTDFAKENLRRDYSVQVMDRNYSRNSTIHQDKFHTINATTSDSYFCQTGRDSLESNTDWHYLQGRETLDTQAGDFPRLSDINTNYNDYSTFERHASAQSTPYFQNEPVFDRLCGRPGTSMYSQTTLMSTPCNMQSQLSEHNLSATDDNLARRFTDRTPAPAFLCPVEVPGVLEFSEVCCVGISTKEVLMLRNPTDKWMECILKVKSLEINGQPVSPSNSAFTFRQNKVIINPGKTEGVNIMFLPNCAGTYVAHVQVFSHSCVKKYDVYQDAIPVNVTLQAIAEDPWISVKEKTKEDCGKRSSIDFGEMVWGSCGEKTIFIRNNGLATVPLRLAIMSNKGWHCFSFEPEGRQSDVSMISGRQAPSSSHGRSIMNVCLSGFNQPFNNYHEVKVWCRPPEKQCTKALCRQPPEIFSCDIDVEVDIPNCKFAKLASLHLTATVGVRKLHIQSNLKEIHLSCPLNKTQESGFKIYNAGNLPLDAQFGFSIHKQSFSVTPTSIILKPGVDAELRVKFMPTDISSKTLSTLLLMLVEPDRQMYELAIQAEVKPEDREIPKLLSDRTKIDFGGVPIGKTCVKRYRLINKGTEAVKMRAMVKASNILIARSADPNTVGSKSLDLFLPAEEIIPVYVLYNPVLTMMAEGKVVMKSVTSPESLKFSVLVAGYGGVSRLCCSEEATTMSSVRGYPCVGIQNFSLGKVKEVAIHNVGMRPAQVRVAVFKDLECRERMLSGQVVVQPSEFVIGENEREKLEIVVSMTEREFMSQADSQGVGAVLCLAYKDRVDSEKPHGSQLIVGLVKGAQPKIVDDVTRTPSISSRTMRFTQHSSDHSRFTDYNQLNDKNDSMNVSNSSCKSDNTGGWTLKPQQLILYCSSRGPGDELDKFYIHNNNNRDIKFEIAWPGKMLSVTPADGTVNARENMYIRIFPTSQVSQCLEKLPWSGTVMVTCDDVTKSLKVEIRRDYTADDTVPEPDDRSLVPISTNIPHSISGTNRLGNLRVSRTTVQFLPTKAGKMTEETLELTNLSNDTFRWMFSSFASPYLKKSDDNNKEVFRVSYKVFDFSRQFGKLAPEGTAQLTLKFMPRSTGTFSQYWDLQTSGHSKSDTSSSHQDYIRIHLTGEGMEDMDASSKSKPSSIDVENLLPKLVGENTRLRLPQDVLEFPTLKCGESVIMKTDMKNSHHEEVQVEVTTPKPPFYVKHPRFKVAKKRFIKLPVEFRPSRSGRFTDVIKFQSSKGDNLVLQVKGSCH